MRNLGRRPGLGLGRAVWALSIITAAALSLYAGAASAREVVVTGSKMNRYGRILLHFDEPTKVQVKATASVLVISFAEPARIRSEKLASEIGPYVSVVRRDPDNTGLRLALAAPLKVNVLEAGERVRRKGSRRSPSTER